MTRVFRFGAGAVELTGEVAAEVGLERLLLVTTRRGAAVGGRLPPVAVYDGVRSHVPAETVAEAARVAASARADGVLAVGGGSAIDTGKAVSAAAELPLVSIPTTYAGAEWTTHYGIRDEARREKGGGGGGRPVAAIYDPELTLDLPRAQSAGTAMNALAHCAEALYAPGRSPRSDRHAFCGARAIAHALPVVLADGASIYGRTRLLEGAMRAAFALADAGLALGHALAQALGGRYGLPHGALNAVCLPAALRFNEPVVPDALAQLAVALGADDAVTKVEELARLGGHGRLRELGVPEDDLDAVAAAAARRPGARSNPRPAAPADIAALLRSIW